jgi:hypothetical protein
MHVIRYAVPAFVGASPPFDPRKKKLPMIKDSSFLSPIETTTTVATRSQQHQSFLPGPAPLTTT